MLNHNVNMFSRIAIFLVACVLVAGSSVAQPLPRSVLILSQTDPGTPWYIALNQALRATLDASSAARVTVYAEDLDLVRFGTSQHEQILLAYFREKYRERPIGTIVAVGSLALEVMLRLRTEIWSNVPVVFAAVDEITADRLRLPPEITGMTMRLTFRDAVTVARALVPDIKRIALVGDPLERQTFRRHFREEIPVFAAGLEIVDLTGLPMTELKARVRALPERTAIVYTAIYSGGDGVAYIPRDALMAVAEVANRPIVVDTETAIGYGGTGGFVVDPVVIGNHAAQVAFRILNGESPANIPVTLGNFTTPVFDWRQLRRWNISENRLPPGSEVRFREFSLWEQYRWQIILIATALLIQTMLIIGLFYERRRRHSAEASSRIAIGRLAHMNQVATAGELSASIAHEVSQPLGAIVANANAGLRWLGNKTPDLEEARAALKRIADGGHRASEVIESVRAMFKKDGQEKAAIDLNALIEDVLGLLRGELQTQGIVVQTELTRPLPSVLGHSGQLQQVVLNLVRNAADAMVSVTGRARVLRVKSTVHDPDGVLVSVEDSGTGVDPKDIVRIFDSFFTTKAQGMGMGLSICRSIIEAHDGRLWASSGTDHGAVFNVQLPAFRPGIE